MADVSILTWRVAVVGILAVVVIRVAAFFAIKALLWALQRRSRFGRLIRQQTAGGVVSVGFFHPFVRH